MGSPPAIQNPQLIIPTFPASPTLAMASKKIIAVIGATGTQGGGVARDLLKDGEFAVRAVTRNPDSASAKGGPIA